MSKTSEWGHTSQSIPSALTTPHTECANSLTLNPQDRLFLAYFSSSTVYCFYDFHEWGILQYLVKEVAPTSRLITRMFLALSASEMYNKGLLSSGSSADDGLRHYTLCLTEFQAEISASTQKEPAEAMIAALFFMIHYELKFTGSLQRVRVHLRGLWALVSTHPLFRQQGQRQTNGAESDSLDVGVLNPSLVLSCQLIAWIMFVNPASTVVIIP